MICPYCTTSLEVTNSRARVAHNEVWRRRRCKVCAAVMTTYEQLDLAKVLSVVSRSVKQPFLREKLCLSIYSCCRHRTAAIADARGLTATVIAKVLSNTRSASCNTKQIALAVMATLEHFDTASAVQYAAFHTNTLKP